MNKTISFNANLWEKIRIKIKKEVGDTAYNNWLKQLSFSSSEDDTITFTVPTKFLRDWIATHYAEKIKNISREYNTKLVALKIVVKPTGGRVIPGTAKLVETRVETKKYDFSFNGLAK